MSAQPDAVVRRWFEEVWNQGNEATIDRLFPAGTVVHGTPGGTHIGPDRFRQYFRMLRGAFPDVHITVERTITEGEFVAAYCRVTGTHLGDTFDGVAATHRPVEFYGVTIGRIVDGRFQEGWNCFDMLTLYQQLGVPPPMPAAQATA